MNNLQRPNWRSSIGSPGPVDDESDSGSFATAELHQVIRRDLGPPPTSEGLNGVLTLLTLLIINGLRAHGDEQQVADLRMWSRADCIG